jgi:hypothetical protein
LTPQLTNVCAPAVLMQTIRPQIRLKKLAISDRNRSVDAQENGRDADPLR